LLIKDKSPEKRFNRRLLTTDKINRLQRQITRRKIKSISVWLIILRIKNLWNRRIICLWIR